MTRGGASIPEVQRLLAVLAAGRRVGEAGTAYGNAAAAMAATAKSIVTVERNPQRAAAAARLLAECSNVDLLLGDWRELLPPRAPFELLFFDAGKLWEAPDAIDLLAPGGLLVKDDLTPGRPGPDPVRELLFGNPRLSAVEILTTPTTAAIIAARI